jgi:hypothetical protein
VKIARPDPDEILFNSGLLAIQSLDTAWIFVETLAVLDARRALAHGVSAHEPTEQECAAGRGSASWAQAP